MDASVWSRFAAHPARWVIGAAALLVALAVSGWLIYIKLVIERPRYEVLQSHPEFEVRRYAPRILAEVDVQGDMQDASSAAFRSLAGYIFGGNEGGSKVAMTSPVDMQPAATSTAGADKTWTMAFTMPSHRTLEDLPKPNDPRVRLRPVGSKTYVAVEFSGKPDEAEVADRIAALRTAAEARGFELVGEAVFARYDDPSIPGPLRRNELLFEIEAEDGP